MKSDGTKYVPLQISEVKQIAGRAGRYKTAADAVSNDTPKAAGESMAVVPEKKTVGWCTTLDHIDHNFLKDAMGREPDPIRTAGLFPPSLIVERFANYFPPGTPFSYILLRLHEISDTHPRFHLCGLKEQLSIADAIHTVKGLSIQDRIMISSAPCNMRDSAEKKFLRTLAECIAEGRTGHLLELPDLPLNVMDEPAKGNRSYLHSLEQLHKMVVLYLWLSYRFPNVFTTRPLAIYTKKLLEDQIENTLTQFSHTAVRKQQMEKRERARMEREKQATAAEKAMGARIPSPPDMPEEAEDILNDTIAFEDAPPATDDLNEYPDEPIEESERVDTPEAITERDHIEQRKSAHL